MHPTQFLDSDLSAELPTPGIYPGTVTTARVRSSQSGNAMVHVVYALEGLPAAYDRVSEYFVLEGASARGLALSRKRLVELFRACGFVPRAGEDIDAAKLLGAHLRVKVDREEWRGELRLRIVGHFSLTPETPPPF